MFLFTQVAAKQNSTLHLNITPMKNPPEGGTGEKITEGIIDIDVKNQKVSVTNTKAQETQEPTEEEVVVMETTYERLEATREEESNSDKDDSYIKPTTNDCKLNWTILVANVTVANGRGREWYWCSGFIWFLYFRV